MWQQEPEEDEDYNFDQEYPAEVFLRTDNLLNQIRATNLLITTMEVLPTLPKALYRV